MDAKEIQKYINERVKNGEKAPSSLEELNRFLADFVQIHNNKPQRDVEGYSPSEMSYILYHTFDENSPIKLQRLSEDDYARIPLLCQIKYLAQIMQKEGKIKLTSAGNLPTRIVKELYPLGVADELIVSGISKLSKESDAISPQLTKILSKIMRIVKVRNNVMTMTKSGEKMVANHEVLMKNLMVAFCLNFNKAFFDAYESDEIGNMGVGFTLLLLSKYGAKKRRDTFYGDKYFTAFPTLLEGLHPGYGTVKSVGTSCYFIRTFDRLLLHLGLVEIEGKRFSFDRKRGVIKTSLFDKLIKVLPPQR